MTIHLDLPHFVASILGLAPMLNCSRSSSTLGGDQISNLPAIYRSTAAADIATYRTHSTAPSVTSWRILWHEEDSLQMKNERASGNFIGRHRSRPLG